MHEHDTLKFKHTTNPEWEELAFMGAKPCASWPGQRRTKEVGSVIRDGMLALFYLQIEKTSTMLQAGNVRQLQDHLVNSDLVNSDCRSLSPGGISTSRDCQMQEERAGLADQS